MPAVARRCSVIFRKNLRDSSALPSSSVDANDDRPICRSRSVLKRTTSVPANTFNAIFKSTAKGARSSVPKPKRSSCSVSSYRLSPSSILKKPSTRLTTFLTAMSTFPTTRVVSQDEEKLCLSATSSCAALSRALSTCTSVMAVCSSMVGGSEGRSLCLPRNGGDPGEVPDSQVAEVVAGQNGPWWIAFVRQWITWQSWSSADWDGADDGGRIEEIKSRKEVSPWLTVFQVSVIMLLTASLCRNVERIWDL